LTKTIPTLTRRSDGEVKCTVLNDGTIRSRVGVNLPGVKTNLPPMSEKDLIDIKYGVENDVDFVAASFVR
jgi:pyruvate kinase